MSAKNIVTGVVVALALVLVGLVMLIKTGVISAGGRNTSTAESFDENDTVMESSIVVASETNAKGETFYYTMVDYYARPRVSSNHTYPTTKPKTTLPPETDPEDFVEMTSVVQLSDENGNPLLDENGEPLTQVISYTVPAADLSTTEETTVYVPRTLAVPVTDRFRRQVTDADGNPVTQAVYLDPPTPPTTTTVPPSDASSLPPGVTQLTLPPQETTTEEVTTSNRFAVDLRPNYSRDDDLAQSIVNAINEKRAEAGLDPVKHDTSLKASARSGSLYSALPQAPGARRAGGSAQSYRTVYGGNDLINQVLEGDGVMNEGATKVGVGVVKYNGQYYTTVIFG